MKVVLIADTYLPLQTSGAVQIHDLSSEFLKQQHEITLLLPSSKIKNSWYLENNSGIRILWLRAPKIKDQNYVVRTVNEFLMPFFMITNLRKSPLAKECWDSVIWYSPSIFFGPLVHMIKLRSKCKAYLIVRDIFPEWAADLGLINRRGFIFKFFNLVANYQYNVADIIGVQAYGNLNYFEKWANKDNRHLEVLQNWIFDRPITECSIKLSNTKLSGRKIFVYAGNMGKAQNIEIFLDLAKIMMARKDIGFIFVGRGIDSKRLAEKVRFHKLNNTLFYDEILPNMIPSLLSQCSIGLIALDPKHKTHNIPGKFLTYMQTGLPVLCRINEGNDLAEIIQKNNIGRVCTDNNKEFLIKLCNELLDLLDKDKEIKSRCRNIYLQYFSPETAVKQITNSLRRKEKKL